MFAAKNLLLAPALASKPNTGPVTLDNTAYGTLSATAAVGTPMTWTHDVLTAGATIFVDIFADRAATVSNVTCAGSAMTLVGTVTFTGGASGAAFISRYQFSGASAGNNTISAVYSTAPWGVGLSASFTGVTSVGAIQSATGSGGSAMTATATLGSGQLILQAFGATNAAGSLLSFGTESGGTALEAAGNGYSTAFSNYATANTTFSQPVTNLGYWGSLANSLA